MQFAASRHGGSHMETEATGISSKMGLLRQNDNNILEYAQLLGFSLWRALWESLLSSLDSLEAMQLAILAEEELCMPALRGCRASAERGSARRCLCCSRSLKRCLEEQKQGCLSVSDVSSEPWHRSGDKDVFCLSRLDAFKSQ